MSPDASPARLQPLPPLRSYDDGSAVLLVVKGGLVFAYDMAPPPPPHQAAAGLQGLGGPPGGPDQVRVAACGSVWQRAAAGRKPGRD